MARIRPATEADAAAVAAIYAPYVRDTAISFEEVPPTPEEMRRRIARTLATHPYLVAEEQGEVVGYASGSQHRERASYRWSCDVGLYVRADHHRRGVGRALYADLLAILARQGFHAAYAGVTLPNDKSVGLHEAMGFRPVAHFPEVGFKFGAWHDVGWWRRPLSEGPPTGEPIRFSELQLDPVL